jgi:hypothetical protein
MHSLEGEAELEQLAVIGVGYADLHETWPNTLCHIPDEDGLELASLDEARALALRNLAETASDTLAEGVGPSTRTEKK